MKDVELAIITLILLVAKLDSLTYYITESIISAISAILFYAFFFIAIIVLRKRGDLKE